jgi:hypothetical protein
MPLLSLAGLSEAHGHRVTENIHCHRHSNSHYGWIGYLLDAANWVVDVGIQKFMQRSLTPNSLCLPGCFDHLANHARQMVSIPPI